MVLLYATVLLTAAALRVWRLSWGLGDGLWFPDELYWGMRAQAFIPISWTSFSPHDLIYPTLYGYLTGFSAALAHAVGLLGAMPMAGAVERETLVAYAAPSILVARGVSAAAGTATVALVGVLGRLLYGPRVGLTAAALLAVTPLHTMQGYYASVDVLLTASFALTLVATHLATARGTLATAALAGACAGLTFTSKFTGLAVVATVGLVILWRARHERAWVRGILLGLAAATGFAGAVFVTCPPCVLQPDLVLAATEYHRAVATSPPLNYSIAPSLGWYGHPYLYQVVAALPFGLGWPLAALALIGVGMAVWRRERSDVLLLAAICPYFLVMGSYNMTCPRYLLPLFPVLVVLAARVVHRPSRWPRARMLLLAGILGYSLALTVSQVRRFSYDQQQEIARWISANVSVSSEKGCVRVAVPHASPAEYHGYYQLKEPLRRRGLTYLRVLDGHWFDQKPEVFILPDWYEIAIRRERHSREATRELERLKNGESGYLEAARWRSSYLQQRFYTWLDPAYAAGAWQGETGFTVYLRERPLTPGETPACDSPAGLRGHDKFPFVPGDAARLPHLEHVALRLDASYFTPSREYSRGPVEKIGNQAREVVAGRERIVIPQRWKADLAKRPLKLDVQLPDETVDLPDSAFTLNVMRARTDVPPQQALLEAVAAGFVRLDRGWSLVRDSKDPRIARLELMASGDDEETQASIRLEAFRPPPALLESREFDLPAEARIELGYGIVDPRSASPDAKVRFDAELRCAGTEPVGLLSDTLDVSEHAEAGWHHASLPAPPSSQRCRMRLSATSLSASTGSPVWAVPRIITRVRTEQASDSRSLVLISLDTLAADHMSGYGYRRETSPNIDRLLVARGTTFTDVSTTFPLTHIAHMSLFTSLYPATYGKSLGVLPPEVAIATFTEVLRGAGFETGAFTEDAYVSGSQGFWFGFDRFTERTGAGRVRGQARKTFADGIDYIRQHRNRKFFLFLHTYQTHQPYHPAPAYQGLFRAGEHEHRGAAPGGIVIPEKHRSALDDYDREIRETDDAVGNFLSELERLGLDQRTYVVLLSDHGEAFGQHGRTGHGGGPQREQLHVPLIVRGPGIPAGRRVTTPASLVDVAPTLLELLGLPPLADSQGASMYPILREYESQNPRPIHFEWSGKGYGVRYGRWKFVEAAGEPSARGQLFDLEADPWEQKPIRGPHPVKERAQEFIDAYKADGERKARALGMATREARDSLVLEDGIKDALRALGYVE